MERVGRHLVALCIALAAIAGCSNSSESPSPPRGDHQASIYVADWANHRIVRMRDMRGGGWTTLGGVGGGGEQVFQFPVGVCVDAARRIYVSQQYHHRVFRMDDMLGSNRIEYSNPSATDKPVNKYGGSWICLDNRGRIYVTYDGEHRVVRMDDMSGVGRVAFGTEGSGVGQFRYPAGLTVDEQGRIYVCDFDNFRVVRMDDMQGSNWIELGVYGSGQYEFINPCGICLDDRGRIYVADQGNDRIVRFDDLRGTNWTMIGSFGTASEAGTLYAPTGICVDRAGRIYVTQCSSNHRIVRMDDMQGTNWTVFGGGGTGFGTFASPMGIYVR